ncbi:MAG: phosphotransferase, partial [archaeon]
MMVSSFAKGEDGAARMRALVEADRENDRETIQGIIEEVRSVGEALGRFHDSFSPSTEIATPDNEYDYNRMKRAIEELFRKEELSDAEKEKLNVLIEELYQLMERSGIRPTAVHGDFHLGNVFIKDGKVSDFIDAETVFWSLDSEYHGIGNPANDLARLLDNLHDRLVESTVSTYIIRSLEEVFLEGYSRTRNISKESLLDAIEFYKARTALVALQYSPSGYGRESAKRRLKAYLNRKNIAELTERLASDLHEGWRAPRKLPASDSRVAQGILFDPRPKPLDLTVDREWLEANRKVTAYDMSKLQRDDLPDTWSEDEKDNAMKFKEKGKTLLIDIANTDYRDLALSWQDENRNAAESGTRLISRRLAEGKQVTLDEEWIEIASAIIHREWLKRPANSWALGDPGLNKDYSLLSEDQKDKNRDIIIQGIRLYNPLAKATDTTQLEGKEPESQENLRSRITYHVPQEHGFVKDAPIMAYRITSDRFEDIPEEIRRHIGAVDRTKYTQEYL